MNGQIRNIAQENAIRKVVDLSHGYSCVSVQPQADYYLVAVKWPSGQFVLRVHDAEDARAQLSHGVKK